MMGKIWFIYLSVLAAFVISAATGLLAPLNAFVVWAYTLPQLLFLVLVSIGVALVLTSNALQKKGDPFDAAKKIVKDQEHCATK